MTVSLGIRPPKARAVTALPANDPGRVTRAEHDALRADLPDPASYAGALSFRIANLLEHHVSPRPPMRATSEAVARELRPLGLCEVRGRMLSNFGCAVRRAIVGED